MSEGVSTLAVVRSRGGEKHRTSWGSIERVERASSREAQRIERI